MEKSSDTRLSGKFALVGVLFLLVVVSIVVHIVELERIRNTWPRISGVVTKVSSKGWWDEKEQIRNYLAYAYEVGATQYENTRFHIKQDSIQRYKHLIMDYKKGDPITVWYNPDKPEDSVINVAFLRNSFVMFLGFAGFVVLSGTMVAKEYQWKKQVQSFIGLLDKDYDGTTPLPRSAVIADHDNVLKINTGMSVFWNFGVPFLFASFLGVGFMLLTLQEINSHLSLFNYLNVMVLFWILGITAGVVMKKGFKNFLDIDVPKGEIRNVFVSFFRPATEVYRFSDIVDIKMEREKWRYNNPLRNWIFYLTTRSNRALFVCYRHRDIQPSSEIYLTTVKKRLERMIFL